MEALSSHRLPALLGRITLTLVLLALIASLWGWGQGSEEPRGKLRLRFVDSGTGQVTPVRVEVLDQEDQAFVGEDPPWSEQYLCLGFTKSDDRILRGYKFSGSFE